MSTNEPMTQEQLDAIRERLSDVGAPWEFAPTPDGDGGEVIRVGEQGGPIAWGIDIDAAGLIAHAPEDLADLLAEVERLLALTTVDDAMTGQTYTREDMARAWEEGRESGTIATMLKLSYHVTHQPANPYHEQEEA